MELIRATKFDQITHADDSIVNERAPRTPASIALELGQLAMQFARIERAPRYEDGRRESDVEHSYMLSLVATEITHQFYPEANVGLVGEYAKVHDLIELVVGDVVTFDLTPQELAAKEAAEHAALHDFLETLPPYTANLLRQYEKQADLESRIVRAVDKLLPIVVDILGQGQRVIHEDHGITDVEVLRGKHETMRERIAERFGTIAGVVTAHEQLCELFEGQLGQQPA